ncbi:uncharacterized protein ACA1_092690 [Acanthamoeba castellanii str. Neff]|uniref:Uncharacterized protein n=1 Tax=Acanthamoeba castellanii (strain ATCC 30010 / Neff) TaxID=1257118 RepID=L8GKL3_ACACF|nr:uncharacterized protein ACA1_092690 [Acanthamoeba castellanii str. Neff]ELR12736.1 hypothetical protein ACA1_092690 [Acanthamoeba castellanii str. Neff]
MEAGGGSTGSVSVSVLDAEIEEFQRHVKRKRESNSQSTDDESSCAALIFLIFSSSSAHASYLCHVRAASPKNETSSSSEKERSKARDRASGSTSRGRAWGAELPSETCRSPVKRLAIAPIPPERFYASSDKKDDAWLQHLETLRKPIGDTYEEFPRQEYRLSQRSNEPDERVVVVLMLS